MLFRYAIHATIHVLISATESATTFKKWKILGMENPLRKYLNQRGLSPREFCIRHRLNYNTILKVLNGTGKPQMRTLNKICEATTYQALDEDMRIWLAQQQSKKE